MIKVLSPELEKLLSPEAELEKCCEGFQWAEGPVWKEGRLYFSDVPRNKMYQWSPESGAAKIFLEPSGGVECSPEFREAGSNGMTLDEGGNLLLCQCGARRIARLEKDGSQTVLADHFEGKKFNSPNDLVRHSSGAVYFTDPTYGLAEGDKSSLRETPWHGVYRVDSDGKTDLLLKDHRWPNGLAFSPDEKTLYLALSDPDRPCIWAYEVLAGGRLGAGKLFFEATSLKGPAVAGTCDGMKVDGQGHLWATVPGGLGIIDKEGKLLGLISSKDQVSNCAWGGEGAVLYLTIGKAVWRIQTQSSGR